VQTVNYCLKGNQKGKGKSGGSNQNWSGGRGKGSNYQSYPSGKGKGSKGGKGKGKGKGAHWTRQVVLSSEQVQPTICNVNKVSEKQLYMEVEIVSKSGQKRMARVLIDTGAEVNLIGSDLFEDSEFELARYPLQLRTVSGEPLSGCNRVISLSMNFCGRQIGSNHRVCHQIHGTFYQAADWLGLHPQLPTSVQMATRSSTT